MRLFVNSVWYIHYLVIMCGPSISLVTYVWYPLMTLQRCWAMARLSNSAQLLGNCAMKRWHWTAGYHRAGMVCKQLSGTVWLQGMCAAWDHFLSGMFCYDCAHWGFSDLSWWPKAALTVQMVSSPCVFFKALVSWFFFSDYFWEDLKASSFSDH